MDSGEMHELLHSYLRQLTWTAGVTKDDLLERLAEQDDVWRTMVDHYLADGTYYAAYEVMDLIPEEAWQSAQGDVWRGGEMPNLGGVPSNFMAGRVGSDESDVSHAGGPAPATPGSGESTRARSRAAGSGALGGSAARSGATAASSGTGTAGSGGAKASGTQAKGSGSAKASGAQTAPRAGEPGDGAGRKYDPESEDAGVWPVSGPPIPDPTAVPQPMASFGQGERGAAGFQDHGDSEMIAIPPDELPNEGASGGSQA
ncbi:MAG TPA: hypothetical protein VFU81_22080 [Thermomicrobiales bacterium]|nr:hypothetical protein [Thermomicrobiales bacterium]